MDVTEATLKDIIHRDLRFEAEMALRDGSKATVHRRTVDNHPAVVETLVVQCEYGTRAGQAAGGDAVWGDWDAEDEVLRTDGEGKAYGLDGKEVPNGRP